MIAGQSSTVSFLLSGIGFLDAAMVESDFLEGFKNETLKVASRFQQVNAGGGSDKLLGGDISNGVGDKGGGDEVSVPEPATTLGLMALGGLGLLVRKKKALQN